MTALIIDDPRVQLMINTLAEQRGSTPVDVVREAVEQQLSEQEQRRIDRLAAIKEIQEEARPYRHLFLTDEDIYDENGLPK
ncbi:MAG: type II toxin-antitoxin system VapB family antitoxin [Propionibacterium sp.]|jgi:rv0623-like transcription factor|nr:type II toxin-antitoxin system VapB family antitoxin [Propionibacterium sp.]